MEQGMKDESGKNEGAFGQALERHGVELRRDTTSVLQVNIGPICNLACRHCHLEAGPARTEWMGRQTMDEVIAAAGRFSFAGIDITGGAPEIVPDIDYLVRGLAPLTPRLMLRCNLTGLNEGAAARFLDLLREVRPIVILSVPAANASQVDALRGEGTWEKTVAAIRELNVIGYGVEGTGLELNLVSNPAGAFLPPGQQQAEKRFRAELSRKHGICFTSLFTFANVPLGRFRTYLEGSGNLDAYLQKLVDGFNPGTVSGLMCRYQLSVDWHGRLYDCDFHLVAGLAHGGGAAHIRELAELPAPGTPIPTADHCYACTVGSGFT
jgi:radical SAM/Cys-rich protein